MGPTKSLGSRLCANCVEPSTNAPKTQCKGPIRSNWPNEQGYLLNTVANKNSIHLQLSLRLIQRRDSRRPCLPAPLPSDTPRLSRVHRSLLVAHFGLPQLILSPCPDNLGFGFSRFLFVSASSRLVSSAIPSRQPGSDRHDE